MSLSVSSLLQQKTKIIMFHNGKAHSGLSCCVLFLSKDTCAEIAAHLAWSCPGYHPEEVEACFLSHGLFAWFFKECNELNSSLSAHLRFSAEPVGLLGWYSVNLVDTGLWVFPGLASPVSFASLLLISVQHLIFSHPESFYASLCSFPLMPSRPNHFPQTCYAITCLISLTSLLTEDCEIHDGEDFLLPCFSFMTCAVLGVSREWDRYSCVNELMKTGHYTHIVVYESVIFNWIIYLILADI